MARKTHNKARKRWRSFGALYAFVAMSSVSILAPALSLAASKESGAGDHQSAVMKTEFIFEKSVFPASHSSTIVETKNGLLAAWFAGPQARHPEVSLWSARHDGETWASPRKVVDGIQEDGLRYQCWNPVLFQPSTGPLLLFYKVGPNPEGWWGMFASSTNQGQTWSKPVRLPEGIIGPVRNKPVELSDGSILCGASIEHPNWIVHMERRFHLGERWEKTAPLNQPEPWAAIQPTILVHSARTIQILCRTRQGVIVESWSEDAGQTWSALTRTSLPNPNSAIDAVRLNDGRFLLVYNHSPTERSVLNVAVSNDGKHWQPALVLENQPGEFSYPAVIQSRDGLVHITYSSNRQQIKHVVVNPAQLRS